MANIGNLPPNMLFSNFALELCVDVSSGWPRMQVQQHSSQLNWLIGKITATCSSGSEHTISSPACKPLRHVCQDALRGLALNAQIGRLTLHVPNFDFTPIITEYFSRLTTYAQTPAAIAAQYLEIRFTFDSNFSAGRGDESHIPLENRNPDEYVEVTPKVRADLQAWPAFHAQEHAAGRPHNISRYQYIKMGNNDAEFEVIRDALRVHNERRDATGEFLRMLIPAAPFVKADYTRRYPLRYAYRDPNWPSRDPPGDMG